MKRTFAPDDALLSSFRVSAPDLVAETPIASVWKVERDNGQHAALKLYRQGSMKNEAPGYAMLNAWGGESAARLIEKNSFAALIEWLDGPSLGDFVREGKDKGASILLVRVACRLHEQPVSDRVKLPSMEDWFQPLLAAKPNPECPSDAAANLARAQALTKALLDTQDDVVALHGDLHHDNIRLGLRGFCAFDAKGVRGERTYELANAFRNPKGASETVRDPARITYLADQWSSIFDVDRARLLGWAAAKCALSIAWRASGEDGLIGTDDEFDLLGSLLNAPGILAV
ncbi:MAG: aminoglycoside phosphotransferase family protein [Pseudomonadota bacterium]